MLFKVELPQGQAFGIRKLPHEGALAHLSRTSDHQRLSSPLVEPAPQRMQLLSV